MTDPAGHYRTTTYDVRSQVVERAAYDKLGAQLSHTVTTFDEIGRAWKSERRALDHRGNPIGDGWSTNTSVFDSNSRVVSSTDDNGVTHRTFYDGANRVRFTRDAAGNETFYHYNGNGSTLKVDYFEVNELTAQIEKSHVEYVLDYSDRVVEYRDRRWNVGFDTAVKTTYDSWGRVTEQEDAGGGTVTTAYDLLSRVTERTEQVSSGNIHTIFNYDADSRVTMRAIEKNPASTGNYQETKYEHDERGRVTVLRRPSGKIWTYRYDANGNRTGWTDPLGTTVIDSFDERNQITHRQVHHGIGINGTTDEFYGYDGLGRLVSCSNEETGALISATQWQYNTLGQIEHQAQTIGRMQPLWWGPQGQPLDGIRTLEVQAEYDGTGFCRSITTWQGRRTLRIPDHMNRLKAIFVDEGALSNGKLIASYTYAGRNRLVERVNGNGTAVRLHYEASGCGCGGATPFVERVEHLSSSGDVLFATDRRFDERGLVTAERKDHEGTIGRVYRYDHAKRLTAVYHGVDLYTASGPDDLGGFADHSTTPTTFGMKVAYNLDPRGNRTSVVRTSDQSTQIDSVAYDVDADTNVYDEVDGISSVFDDIEQMTEDGSTGVTIYYDYKGQKVQVVGGASLDVRYDYDNQGKLILERYGTAGGGSQAMSSTFSEEEGPPTAQDPGRSEQTVYGNNIGCCCDGADLKLSQISSDDGGQVTSDTSRDHGPDASAPGSADCYNPETAATPSGPSPTCGSPVHDAMDGYEHAETRYHHTDQQGSLVGTTDEDGNMSGENSYTNSGEPVYKSILVAMFFSGGSSSMMMMSSGPSTHDSSNGTTLITGYGNPEWNGCEMRIARPTASSLSYVSAGIMHSGLNPQTQTAETLVYDPDGEIHDVLSDHAQNGTPMAGGGPVVYGNPSGYEGAVWAGVGYDEDTGRSTLIPGNGFLFSSAYTGSYIQANMASGQTWQIESWDNQLNAILIAANVTSSVSVGDAFLVPTPDFIHSPRREETNSGFWYEAPTYDSGSDETTFYAPPVAQFEDFQVGWLLMPNVKKPCRIRVKDVLAASGSYPYQSRVVVAGDCRDLADEGSRFRLIAPIGAEQDTGEMQMDPWQRNTRRQWNGYDYQPPHLGFRDGMGNFQRRAPGPGDDVDVYDDNREGQYYCWNRTYDVRTATWTTPDPAASPWWNLQIYCNANYVGCADPSGLQSRTIKPYSDRDTLINVRLENCCCVKDEDALVEQLKRTFRVIDAAATQAECLKKKLDNFDRRAHWSNVYDSLRLVEGNPEDDLLKRAVFRFGYTKFTLNEMPKRISAWENDLPGSYRVTAGDRNHRRYIETWTWAKDWVTYTGAVRSHVNTYGFYIECHNNCGGKLGWVSALSMIFAGNYALHICCDLINGTMKDSDGDLVRDQETVLRATLLHELSHMKATAYHGDKKGGDARDANQWEELATLVD